MWKTSLLSILLLFLFITEAAAQRGGAALDQFDCLTPITNSNCNYVLNAELFHPGQYAIKTGAFDPNYSDKVTDWLSSHGSADINFFRNNPAPSIYPANYVANIGASQVMVSGQKKINSEGFIPRQRK